MTGMNQIIYSRLPWRWKGANKKVKATIRAAFHTRWTWPFRAAKVINNTIIRCIINDREQLKSYQNEAVSPWYLLKERKHTYAASGRREPMWAHTNQEGDGHKAAPRESKYPVGMGRLQSAWTDVINSGKWRVVGHMNHSPHGISMRTSSETGTLSTMTSQHHPQCPQTTITT